MKKNITRQHIITDATMHMHKTQYTINAEQNKLLKSIKLLTKDSKYEDFTFDNLLRVRR